MKAKEFEIAWNKANPDLHFYVEEHDGDILEVRIRFRAHKYRIDPVQWRQFKSMVFSRSNKTMTVASGKMFFDSGAVDIIANPCWEAHGDVDRLVAETLEYLGKYVFPEYQRET